MAKGIREQVEVTVLVRHALHWWLLSILGLSVLACDGKKTEVSSTDISPTATVKLAMPADAAKVTKQLLDADCLMTDTGPDAFALCVKVQAAQLPPLDPAHRDHFGELYDPTKYLECRIKNARIGDTCARYRLRRVENPEYWPYPDVPPIKWPEPPSSQTYKPGMTSEDYFKALCEKEAGEFIYKTVENVEGVYQIRPRQEESDFAMKDRYVIEDPYGQTTSGLAKAANFYVRPNRFAFFESPDMETVIGVGDASAHATRKSITFHLYSGYDGRDVTSMRREKTNATKSRYGFTWRGISRPMDRVLGIAGGELVVVDLGTNKNLGLQRNFVRSGNMKGPSGFWWLTSQSCPQITVNSQEGLRKQRDYEFVLKVLKPYQLNR